MIYTISSEYLPDAFSVQTDTVNRTLTGIAVLLGTKKGTAPMYRSFGLPMEFLDKPPDIAETMAFSEISDALEKFCPDAELHDVHIEKKADGSMKITVEVDIDEQEQ